MPGNIVPAAPTAVFLVDLTSAFTEERRREQLVNDYPDIAATIEPLTVDSRRFFRLTKPMRPSEWNAIRNFWNTYRDGRPFWFYSYREGTPDPSGVSLAGRYAVVFDGPWEEQLSSISLIYANCGLREVV